MAQPKLSLVLTLVCEAHLVQQCLSGSWWFVFGFQGSES